MFDQKTYAERHDGDAEFPALLREWVGALDALRADAENEGLLSRVSDIENAIIDRHGGPVALAVKIFVYFDSTDAGEPRGCLSGVGEDKKWLDERWVVSLMRDAARLVPEIEKLVTEPAPAMFEEETLIDPEGEAIRRECEQIMADILPTGDAGLVEAERRAADIRRRLFSLPDASGQQEAIRERAEKALRDLEDAIDTTPPRSLPGARAKLRRLLDPEAGLPTGSWPEAFESLRQIADLIEREAARPCPIADAPRKVGTAAGDCLLFVEGEWIRGRWAGDAWADEDGLIVEPTHFAPLPAVPASPGAAICP